jgi:hypothetical protein
MQFLDFLAVLRDAANFRPIQNVNELTNYLRKSA